MTEVPHENGLSAKIPLARGLKIGLLGGSFNPAHEGHMHITLTALKRLGLDQIWWLVSPQNPLKTKRDMAPFQERLKTAQNFVTHPDVRVLGLEQRFQSNYSLNTVESLRQHCPQTRFIWIMAADNFIELENWHHWQKLMNLVPMAIMDRPGYALQALSSKAAQRFSFARRNERQARTLVHMPAPAWIFLTGPRHSASATEIRLNQKQN